MKRIIKYLFLGALIASMLMLCLDFKVQTSAANQVNEPAYKSMFKASDHSGIAVLTYHRIEKDTPVTKQLRGLSANEQLHAYNVSETEFQKQLQFFKDHHIQVISYEKMLQLKQAGPIHGKYVVLTFDDVDRTMPDNALKLLNRYQYPFTCFVVTGYVNKKIDGVQMANWQQLKELDANPLATLGVHTDHLHYQIDGKPALQSKQISDQAVIDDYHASQESFKKHLGHFAEYFTYPYGATNPKLTSYMLQNGIKSVSDLNSGLVQQQTDNGDIPRMLVNHSSWKNLAQWLTQP